MKGGEGRRTRIGHAPHERDRLDAGEALQVFPDQVLHRAERERDAAPPGDEQRPGEAREQGVPRPAVRPLHEHLHLALRPGRLPVLLALRELVQPVRPVPRLLHQEHQPVLGLAPAHVRDRERVQLHPPREPHRAAEHADAHVLPRAPAGVHARELDARHPGLGERAQAGGRRAGLGDAQDAVEDVEGDGDEDVRDRGRAVEADLGRARTSVQAGRR